LTVAFLYPRLSAQNSAHLCEAALFAAVMEKKMANVILLILALLCDEPIEKPEIEKQLNIQEIHGKK
jgi:hypothetical protein